MTDERRPTHLDLFSGIGGFALAAQWAGFRTVAFVERDKFCQAILAQHWPSVPIYSDICQFGGRPYRGVDLLTGGFPCQPFSQAGKRLGTADDRALWPEMFRVIKESKPTWLIGENVAGFVSMELDRCCADLEGEGYEVWPLVIPACAVDARHRRDRVWIVANRTRNRAQGPARQDRQPQRSGQRQGGMDSFGVGEASADANEPRSQGRGEGIVQECSDQWTARPSSPFPANANIEPTGRSTIARQEHCEWEPEPAVGRVAHGIPRRVDRLKGLGNAIVPQVAYEIIAQIAKQIKIERRD